MTKVAKGDKVTVFPYISDGDCKACQRGLVNCCDQVGFIGLSGWGGGMAESIVVPENLVIPIIAERPTRYRRPRQAPSRGLARRRHLALQTERHRPRPRQRPHRASSAPSPRRQRLPKAAKSSSCRKSRRKDSSSRATSARTTCSTQARST